MKRSLKFNVYRINNLNINNNYLYHCYFGSQFYKVFGQKFSIYREGSFRFNFVPSFSDGQNVLEKSEIFWRKSGNKSKLKRTRAIYNTANLTL